MPFFLVHDNLFMQVSMFGWRGGGGTGKGVALKCFSILSIKFPILGTGKLFKSDKTFLSVFNKTAL